MTDLDEAMNAAEGSPADGPGAGASSASAGAVEDGDSASPGMSPETASLLGLIDRLASLLERSDLVELEVEAGETGILLRKPAALQPVAAAAAAAASVAGALGAAGTGQGAPAPEPAAPAASKAVVAPLTGIFYGAPNPGSPPFVTAGQHVVTGQVIGLIEAMKLFNEIKSDVSGRVLRVVAESGKLVKAKSPLIEVEPL